MTAGRPDIDRRRRSRDLTGGLILQQGRFHMSSAAEASARVKRIPLRDFFRNPERSSFQISPDGATLAFMQPYQNRINVFVQPRAGGEPVRLTSETERDVAGYFWKGSRRIVSL